MVASSIRDTARPSAPVPGSPHPSGVGGAHRTSVRARILGRQPIGMVLAAPYAAFIAAVFAFPLGFAVWMSFHDYFFTAPGVSAGT